jgi:spermidine synthase
MSGAPEILAMESPWYCQPGVVRVPLRPGESPAQALALRIGREGMRRPYIFDTPHERRLHFTQDATQSAMSRLDPDSLVAPYTRKMMAFLLMNPNPRHIVMLGLGGGSLAKFCYRHLPKTRITVVEIDPDIIAMRDEFLIPPDDARFRVIRDDGARYVEHHDEPIDALLVDAFDADGIANSLANPRFYAGVQRRLTERGVFVMNLWGKPDRFTANVELASAAFGANALLISVLGELNLLLFASRRPPPKSITEELAIVADRLQQELQLDFPRYLRRICQGETVRGLPTSMTGG